MAPSPPEAHNAKTHIDEKHIYWYLYNVQLEATNMQMLSEGLHRDRVVHEQAGNPMQCIVKHSQ